MYYLLISPSEASTHRWAMRGPFTTEQAAADARQRSDYTKEHYLVSIEELVQMCRAFTGNDDCFYPPVYVDGAWPPVTKETPSDDAF